MKHSLAVATSLVLHATAILALAFLFVSTERRERPSILPISTLTVAESPPTEAIVELAPIRIETPTGSPLVPSALELPATVPDAPNVESPLAGQSPTSPAYAEQSLAVASPSQLVAPTGLAIGGGFEGRTADSRGQMVSERGGSTQSEAAVAQGLEWLVRHQHSDGSWHFDHRGQPCDGRCRNPGNHNSTTAATALGLLPLLGAGHTNQYGEHQLAVARGLEYLKTRLRETPHGGDLQEGTMYGQGLATLALCEAYAMTGDATLQPTCQQAIDYIVYAQHPRGGWRYFPHQPGDTTVWGWQVMALRSGQLAGLQVPPSTLALAAQFLDSVQANDGAAYGYLGPEADRSPTAIGLLGRMYFGARRSDDRLNRGTTLLAEWGPSPDDQYFNYYATQVLHHYDGPKWDAWNAQLRDSLIASQSLEGHEKGSWYFADGHTLPGGRLCDTSLALMILEVYYRHMPLYGWQSTEGL